jgi:hypothetical protein
MMKRFSDHMVEKHDDGDDDDGSFLGPLKRRLFDEKF